MASKRTGEGDLGAQTRKAESRARKEGPARGRKAKASGSHRQMAGEQHTGDKAQARKSTLIRADTPMEGDYIPSEQEFSDQKVSLTDYKGTALKNVGRTPDGKVIPHRRQETIAKKIVMWVAGGYVLNDIAVLLNIRPGLIKEHYSVELNHGNELMGMGMTEHILRRAKKSDRVAIFVAKSRMGWRDGDGKPVDTSVLNLHIHA